MPFPPIDLDHLPIFISADILFWTFIAVRLFAPNIVLALARDFDRYMHNRTPSGYVRYALRDKNDRNAYLLRILYFEAEHSDRIVWQSVYPSTGYSDIVNQPWKSAVIHHEDQFLYNGNFTYYRHEPFIYHNGLNGDATITLLVPRPALTMLWTFWILGIRIVPEHGTIEYYTEVSGYMRITSKLKNIKTSRARYL